MELLTLGCVLLAGVTRVAEARSFSPAGEVDRAAVILAAPAGYEKASADPFSRLIAEAGCNPVVPRKIDVALRWELKREGGQGIRIDVTELRDGFETGRYVTSGERSPQERTIGFEGADAGILYYWRLLVKRPEGWTFVGNGRFEAPIGDDDEDEEERE